MTEPNCLHPKTVLIKLERSELLDGELISYRKCVTCDAPVTTIEVRVPEGMAVTAAMNRVKQFLEDSKVMP